ncbi:uncharacterized protein ASPGLDRAFT_28157 [Aspergillus glaucus CBS 516.65]|uniref:Aminoglycoside phosphotransferase domain-containing protein n=1 Tax=Aspergillus glaucus CBS 516.65 TaxID=1160497 RepID=A0A1L9VBP5_ASPGL|nr:hypothetical protein ASPGLDRAFT_28157 [Aspergillus glaucus CBS 516.65]OJJ81320.1 hypothetical protein ASPGLDRAFT_28157 [Aspergillus glaucus CBS 516.65]
MDRKRKIDDTNSQTISVSKAAKFNAHTSRKLQAAVSHDPEIDLTTQMPIDYTGRLIRMQTSKEVLGERGPLEGSISTSQDVFKCAADIVVKAVRHIDDYTEYTTLQYLERHIPDCPAPRPLGCVQMSGISLIFLTHKPSKSLGEVWHGLDSDQEASAKGQLETILTKLRSLPYVHGRPLGGMAGEGCKDARRHLRRSNKPIKTLSEFVEFLRQLSPCLSSPPNIVFTHGDLRPDNITVEIVDCNRCVVTGLLDWEYSGFYPDYYEAVRCTNSLSSCENDWFLFLPDCISPKRYTHWWLLDRVRETRSM